MMRVVFAVLTVCLVSGQALAASPAVDSAIKVFQAVGADPAKLKVFCEMTTTMNAASEKEDAAADAKIDGYMNQLGADFQKAWNAGEGMNEASDDGKAYNGAIDALIDKCPDQPTK